LKAAAYVDVVNGELIEPAIIIVEDQFIVAVNPEVIPDGEEIDLGSKILLPGLIDMHVHLTGSVAPNGQLRGVTETPAAAAFRAMINAETTLMAGFTTVRNLGSGDFIDVELAKFSARGEVISPWIVPAAHSISTTGGHGDNGGYSPFAIEQADYKSGVADGVDGVTQAVRYQIKHGAKVIKFTATAGVLSFEGPVGAQQYSSQEMAAIVEEASRHGIKVAAHAHGSEGILAAVRAGVASIEHGSMLNQEIIDEMKARGTYLVPTIYITDTFDFDAVPPIMQEKGRMVIPLARESLGFAIREGVNIAFGTDAAVIPHGENAGEFAAMVRQGMSNADAIRTATVNAADLLGVVDRSQIDAGRLADIIAVEGNPLLDVSVLEHVDFVMKGGVIYKQ
jgi:imidazolonepropionase-like amidohydrolase